MYMQYTIVLLSRVWVIVLRKYVFMQRIAEALLSDTEFVAGISKTNLTRSTLIATY